MHSRAPAVPWGRQNRHCWGKCCGGGRRGVPNEPMCTNSRATPFALVTLADCSGIGEPALGVAKRSPHLGAPAKWDHSLFERAFAAILHAI